MAARARTNGHPITRQDLEAAFSRLTGDAEQKVRTAMPRAVVAGAAVAVAVVTLAYLAGKRRGRRRSSVIEIRRI